MVVVATFDTIVRSPACVTTLGEFSRHSWYNCEGRTTYSHIRMSSGRIPRFSESEYR